MSWGSSGPGWEEPPRPAPRHNAPRAEDAPEAPASEDVSGSPEDSMKLETEDPQ